MKNPETVFKYWLKHSSEDLETAKSLLKSSRYTWLAFICQQSVEKYLKAIYVKRKETIPPYIHKLERLCQILELNPPKEIIDKIIHIDKYYIVTRYPTYKREVNVSNKETAKKILNHTEEILS